MHKSVLTVKLVQVILPIVLLCRGFCGATRDEIKQEKGVNVCKALTDFTACWHTWDAHCLNMVCNSVWLCVKQKGVVDAE